MVFRFKRPYAPLLLQLDATEAPIVPRHVYQGSDPQANPANAAPIGTGAFKLASYKKGAEIRLVRNGAYFKPLPHLDEVVMRIIPDLGKQVLALESGEVDFLWGVPGPHQGRLAADARVRTAQTSYHPGGSNCIMTVSFNLDRPVLKDVRVRRAVAHGARPRGVPAPGDLQRGQGGGRADLERDRVGARVRAQAAGPRPGRGRAAPRRRGMEEGARRRPGGARGRGDPRRTRLTIDFLHFPAFANTAS